MAKSIKSNKIQQLAESPPLEAIFQIRGIELISYNLTPSANQDIDEFRYDFRIGQHLQQKDGIAATTITLGVLDKQNNVLGDLAFKCHFEVENISELVLDKNGLKEFQTKLNKIAVGTARGLMFGIFRGTALHNAILPIVDAQNFAQ